MVLKRQYNFETPEHRGSGKDGEFLPPLDGETIKWMKRQAKEEGITYGQWCRENGIMSEWDEKKANREIPASRVGPRTMADTLIRMSEEVYDDTFPGGEQTMSILVDARSVKVKQPKRKRGRPRKHFFMVEAEI